MKKKFETVTLDEIRLAAWEASVQVQNWPKWKRDLPSPSTASRRRQDEKRKRMNEIMTALLLEKQSLTNLERKIEEAKEKISKLALEAQEANEGNPSFKHGDKWYQVRKRKGKAYVCEFDREPGSWRKKP